MKIIAIRQGGLNLEIMSALITQWETIDENAIRFEFDDKKIKDLYSFGKLHQIDFLCANNPHPPKLAIFDMDSTLVNGEVINELAKIKNVEESIAIITKRAMNGELDFTESLRLRLNELSGIHLDELQQVHQNLKTNPGVENLMKALQIMGVKTYIASGGFSFFAERLMKDLNMDGQYSNTLEFKNNKTTGKVLGPIIDAKRKKEILILKAQELGITLDETMAVGDGANDLEMIGAAGCGVAYHAKDIVREQSPIQLNYNSMDALLYLWK